MIKLWNSRKRKEADVIVVNGNPVEDIDVLADVLAVFKLGKKLDKYIKIRVSKEL
ncbi:MAG: hypothetical protein ACLTRP_12430 [Clostridioides difficile]